MEIRPESKTLEKILTGLETRYKVPDYQRDYSWTTNEVDVLWTDLKNATNNSSEYFMGTIVLKVDKGDVEEQFEIVDGQQRLATFSILFSVIHKIAKGFTSHKELFSDVKRDKESEKLTNKIISIAMNRLREPSEPDNYYLQLNRKDGPIFKKIIEAEGPVLLSDTEKRIIKSESRLKKTEKMFFSKITEDFKGQNALVELNKFLIHIVKKLRFITIEVKSDYDAFLLFESLNSKGMELSVSDLVKNKMLMHTDQKNNDELLNNWAEMMRLVGASRVNPVEFIRVYWEAIQNTNTTKKELYKYVSKHIELNNTIEFSVDLKGHAENLSTYADRNLVFPSSIHLKEDGLSYCGELNYLKYTTCYPVLMYTYEHKEALFGKVAQLSLSFLFRWITVGDNSVGGAKKVFDDVLNNLKNAKLSEDEIIAPFFSEKEKIGDKPFKKNISNFKTQDNSIAKYILSKEFLYHSKGEAIPNHSEIHLEHILPQNTKLWEEDGFEITDGTTIEDWVYHIGNMVLLNKTINSKIKNQIFNKKYKEYKDSPFPVTNKIYHSVKKTVKPVWGVEHIVNRGKDLSKIAHKIWPLDSLKK
jgi:uncharacterized protein with ParB-like and HNH nuclease domain